MTNLALYHAIPSRSLTVHWALEELGVDYEIRPISIEAGDHKTPEYLALNPMGRVPTLVHGDIVVTETAAICAYLADAFPEAGLSVPLDSPDRGAWYRWLFFAPVTMEPSVLWAAGNLAGGDYEPFASIDDVANTLRLALADKKFIVGDHFTAADIMIAGGIWWGTTLMPVLPKHPELMEYLEGIIARPAYQRSIVADLASMRSK